MRTLVILGILAAGILGLADHSEAGCRQVIRRAVVVEQPAVVVPAVVPITVAVPQYSITLQQPSAYQADQSASPAALNELALQIGTLRQQLAACEAALKECQRTHPAPTVVPPVTPPVHPPVVPPVTPPVHPPVTPVPLGLAPLTQAQVLSVFQKTYNQTMPKGGPALTDQEESVVAAWVGNNAQSNPEIVSLFTAKCASCHAASVAAAKGKSFILLK